MTTLKTPNLSGGIGARIRQLRTEKRLSQGDIENKTGMLRCYISRVENGHTIPSLETLERFAAALGTPLYRLFANRSEVPVPSAMPALNTPDAGHDSPPEDPYFLRLKEIIQNMNETDRYALISLAEKLARRQSGE